MHILRMRQPRQRPQVTACLALTMPKGGRPTASSYASTPTAQLSMLQLYHRSERSLLSVGRCLSVGAGGGIISGRRE